MANPTTAFGWVMPNSADLVTDLPADFNVFGQGVDTSMQFLLGGTTGQVLSKTSATNMAFTWTTPQVGDITGVTAGTGISGGGTSGDVTVTNSMATAITTNGDLIRGTGSGTFARLGIGSTGQVLTVAAGIPSWAASAGGGKVLQVVYGMYNTQTLLSSVGYTATGLTASITPTLNTSKILVMTSNFAYWSESSGNPGMAIRIMRGSTSVYDQHPTQNSLGIIIGTTGARGLLGNVVLQYLDEPATTSSTTYTTQARTNCAAYLQWDAGKSNIILMEIGA